MNIPGPQRRTTFPGESIRVYGRENPPWQHGIKARARTCAPTGDNATIAYFIFS